MELRNRRRIWSSPVVADGVVFVGSFDDRVYAFGSLELTPPNIDVPSSEPSGDVSSGQEVTVSVKVTDAESGVRKVILSYTTSNCTSWLDLSMNWDSTAGLYEATITGQPAGMLVKYKIIAYDNAENQAVNDNEGEYYVYRVTAELLSPISPQLFTALSIIAILALSTIIILAKRRLAKKS